MTNLNIMEADLVADVRAITEEIVTDKIEEENSQMLFFGNLDVSMQEIDAAIMKLQKLSACRSILIEDDI